jgi:hypothetical protein
MQMPLGKQQPIITGMLDQPSTSLYEPLLQASQRPDVDLFGSTSRRRRLPKL